MKHVLALGRFPAAPLLLVTLPHCMVNGELIGPRKANTTATSAAVARRGDEGAPRNDAQGGDSTGGGTNRSASTKTGNGGTSPEKKTSGTDLPDTKGMKLSSNGLPYLNQAEAKAFFSSLSPSMLSHVVEGGKPIWQATIDATTNLVSPNYYYFGKPSQREFTEYYFSPLPKPDREHLAFDANHVIVSGHVLSAEYPTLKKGTPGVVYWLQGGDMRDRSSRTVFATLDGAVYVTFDELHAVSFAPGAGPVSDWPGEVQNPFVPHAFSGLSSSKHKQTYDAANGDYDACEDKVKSQFAPQFDANDVANITQSTRANREKQIGLQQEKAIFARCGKAAERGADVELRATKAAVVEELAFRTSLYAANRARFGKN